MISVKQSLAIPQAEIDKHLEMGRLFLSKGQLQDALSHYHAAVDGDPHNYLTYFKRGTVYLALGKAKSAIADLDKVIELKPDFIAAKQQRANAFLKQGDLHLAKQDFIDIYVVDGNEESEQAIQKIDVLSRYVDSARQHLSDENHAQAIDLLTMIIEDCPWSYEMRELRSMAYVATGDTTSAILDLRSANKLQSDSTAGYLKLAMLHYQLGQAQESLREVRECLKLDPEHKDCFPHYKKVKKIDKLISDCHSAIEEKRYDNCIDSALKLLKSEDQVQMIQYVAKEKLCHCYLQSDQITSSLQYCGAALAIHKDPAVLCDRAEAYIASDMFDDAIRDFQDALELNQHFQRAKDGVQRAQQLQKQAEKRDYYKILGVGRRATKTDITKAYRKLALKWHPDNFQDEIEKKQAEKKFMDIAAAKEVLTDPEKRERFDKGEDPLDPENPHNQQHGFNPFQQFHQFHGSPFQFKFHFN
ncbi:dnaJ homolog subfamily C member 3 [Homalodisca vitripennis]|uniref:dnaJ homolog subfamily C member 3 n=1 Tax=Homalodisca vitripennis TaxID=197043 RepID=UPI001EEB2397|nr:dnaJ homolog subfamily C member 3 [Homalodisca vitripennis]